MSKQILWGAAFAAMLAGAAYGAAAERPPGLPVIDFATAQVKTTDLGHGVYRLEGANVNTTLAVAKDGAIVVDDGWPPMAERLKAAIAKITNQPVRYVVNTHFHSDHSGGNLAFARMGATIVAQDNVPRRLAQGYDSANGNHVPPAPAEALPAVTFSHGTTIHLDGQTAIITAAPAAHTDGDAFVYFPEANVLATGDLFNSFAYELANAAHGGTMDGLIAAEAAMLDIIDDNTKIVPGHGPVTDKQDMAKFYNMLVVGRQRVAALIKEGKSEDAAVAAKPIADLSAKMKREVKNDDGTVRAIYRALKPQ